MGWPTPQDYNEAMQAPWLNLNDRALKSGKPALDFLGLPRPMTGAFASVYRVECEGRTYAVKLFLRKVPDQQSRYAELSKSINSKDLFYTVGFQYQHEGVTIRGENYPLLKMDWAEGVNLDAYVADHLAEPGALSVLLHHFRKMTNKLRQSGVAHGDLQHGNILVKNGELRLVDYDGMYVSQLKGLRSNELGHSNFQHPARSAEHFAPYLDNFSAWSIHTSLLCLSVDPSLWQKLSAGDDCLLFRKADYATPLASDAFKLLENHESESIRTNAKLLRYILTYPVEQVPPLDERITDVGKLPPIQRPGVTQAQASTSEKGRTPQAPDSHPKPIVGLSSPAAAWTNSASLTSKSTTLGTNSNSDSDSSLNATAPNIGQAKNASPAATNAVTAPATANNTPIVGFDWGWDFNKAEPAGGNGLPDWLESTASVTYTPPPAESKQNKARVLAEAGAWPRYDQYKQAFSEPEWSCIDPELKRGKLVPENKGLGTHGFVFHLRCPTRHVAVKCFKEHLPDRQQRFEAIRKYVGGEARRYFIDFDYLPEGIIVGDLCFPVLKMEWTTPTLGEFINTNLRNKSRLSSLSDKFHTMIRALQILGIAHGDLEPDNIMVVNGDFKLVDYDGMYIPELEGLPGIEKGHPAFQHPGRSEAYFGPNLDYFSAWILDAELAYMKIDPQLWAQAEIRSQVAVAKTSRVASLQDFSFLDTHPSKSVKHTAEVLRKLLDYDFDALPPFDPKAPLYTVGDKRPPQYFLDRGYPQL